MDELFSAYASINEEEASESPTVTAESSKRKRKAPAEGSPNEPAQLEPPLAKRTKLAASGEKLELPLDFFDPAKGPGLVVFFSYLFVFQTPVPQLSVCNQLNS